MLTSVSGKDGSTSNFASISRHTLALADLRNIPTVNGPSKYNRFNILTIGVGRFFPSGHIDSNFRPKKGFWFNFFRERSGDFNALKMLVILSLDMSVKLGLELLVLLVTTNFRRNGQLRPDFLVIFPDLLSSFLNEDYYALFLSSNFILLFSSSLISSSC